MSARSISTSKESVEGNMSDDDQDFLDSLEKEATEYNKVCSHLQGIHLYAD